MNRIVFSFTALAIAAVGAAACGDDDIIIGSPAMDAGVGGSGGRAGSGGGTAGSAGRAGVGGSAGTGGSAAGSTGTAGGDAPDAGEPDAGELDAGELDGGAVTPGPVDASAGGQPDPVCESAVDVITALPYDEPWATTDDTPDLVNLQECQVCDNTGDYIVTFTAPETATYRFTATSSGDVELAVYSGECTSEPDDAVCGEDGAGGGGGDQAEVDIELAEGESVSVVVGESCEEEGGAGTLTVDIAP